MKNYWKLAHLYSLATLLLEANIGHLAKGNNFRTNPAIKAEFGECIFHYGLPLCSVMRQCTHTFYEWSKKIIMLRYTIYEIKVSYCKHCHDDWLSFYGLYWCDGEPAAAVWHRHHPQGHAGRTLGEVISKGGVQHGGEGHGAMGAGPGSQVHVQYLVGKWANLSTEPTTGGNHPVREKKWIIRTLWGKIRRLFWMRGAEISGS